MSYTLYINMKNNIFEGVGTALITPFKNGAVDYYSLENILDKQLEANIDALIILGTTGEPATISYEERKDIVKFCIRHVKKRSKIIVGCGTNCTETSIKYYNLAEELGADGTLIVTPYYNKCTQSGLVEHYSAISNSGNLPIIVYNVPGRTGVNISPESLMQIAKIQNVYGIKEASGNVSQMLEYFKLVGEDIGIYSGEDSINNIFYMLGAAGSISVLSNIVPKQTKKVYDMVKIGNIDKANKLQLKLLNLINCLFLEVNPIPIKAGMSYLGLCENELRMPLTKMTENGFSKLKEQINLVWQGENDCM